MNLATLKRHWVWISSTIAALILAANPDNIQQFAASHPRYSGLLMALWGLALAWARSPRQKAS